MDVHTHEPVIIVGAGPIGLACACSARRRGLDPLVVDAGAITQSIVGYPVGMTFFTTPERLEIGGHPLVCAAHKPTREEALKYYRGVARAEALRVSTYTRLVGAVHGGDRIECILEKGDEELGVTCDRLVLATGYFDSPRYIDVPGEDLPHVSHYYDEGHLHYDRDVVVVGGKNAAIEAALELYRCGARVTLVYRRAEWRPTVKYWLRPDIDNRIAAGEIAARFETEVERIERTHVVVRGRERDPERIPADRVFLLTGYRPDFSFFREMGIEIDDATGVPTLDPETLETNVPGIHLAGSLTRGYAVSEIFIENGRFDGEKIFGPLPESR
jgi:thioredoxin reductase (NADPH)